MKKILSLITILASVALLSGLVNAQQSPSYCTINSTNEDYTACQFKVGDPCTAQDGNIITIGDQNVLQGETKQDGEIISGTIEINNEVPVCTPPVTIPKPPVTKTKPPVHQVTVKPVGGVKAGTPDLTQTLTAGSIVIGSVVAGGFAVNKLRRNLR